MHINDFATRKPLLRTVSQYSEHVSTSQGGCRVVRLPVCRGPDCWYRHWFHHFSVTSELVAGRWEICRCVRKQGLATCMLSLVISLPLPFLSLSSSPLVRFWSFQLFAFTTRTAITVGRLPCPIFGHHLIELLQISRAEVEGGRCWGVLIPCILLWQVWTLLLAALWRNATLGLSSLGGA